MQSIAILGLGAMGSRVADNLLRAGHRLTLWNRTRRACEPLVASGASAADSPADAARNADIVISMLTDDVAAREVWLAPRHGALAGLGRGQIAIESSTTTPGWCRELGEAVFARDAGFLDAPVLGSRPQAQSGQLIYLVGGDENSLREAGPTLEVNAARIEHLGPVATGMTAKLAINAIFATQTAVLAETLGMLARLGLSDAAMVALFADLPTTSPALRTIGDLIAARCFDPLFPIDLVAKDLACLSDVAAASDARTPVVTRVREVFDEARRSGHGSDNIHAVARMYLA